MFRVCTTLPFPINSLTKEGEKITKNIFRLFSTKPNLIENPI